MNSDENINITDIIKNEKISPIIIYNLIKNNNYSYLKLIFEHYIFNNNFILKLLSYYKKKNEISDEYFNKIINDERNKISFEKLWYKCALNNRGYAILNILYENDNRAKDIVIRDIHEVVEFEKETIKKEFLEHHKNNDFIFQVDDQLIEILKSDIKNIKNIEQDEFKDSLRGKISNFISKNQLNELKYYMKRCNVSLYDHFDYRWNRVDYIIGLIENNASMEMIKFFIQRFEIENINSYNMHTINRYFYKAVEQNRFDIADYFLSKITYSDCNRILEWLNKDNALTTKTIKYMFNNKNNFFISSETIKYFISQKKIKLLKKILISYCYNQDLILRFLLFHKNGVPLSSQQIDHYFSKERNKTKFNKEAYEAAINYQNENLDKEDEDDVNIEDNNDNENSDSGYKKDANNNKNNNYNQNDIKNVYNDEANYELLKVLYLCDNRNKKIIQSELLQIFNDEKINNIKEKKINFIKKIKNKELVMPGIDNYYLNNLYHPEQSSNLILNYIFHNKINELKYYIERNRLCLSYFNDNNFDILIYAIEKDSSSEMIKFLISHYDSLNYYICNEEKKKDDSLDYYDYNEDNKIYVSPLSYSLSKEKVK
eukprot:jgi/Orpsp1_1/1191150/evm.model.d7180000083817.1